MRQLLVSLPFSLILLLGQVGLVSAQRQKKLKAYDLSLVDRKIQRWVDSGYYPGASILAFKDDKVVLEKYYGNYTPESVVYIASAGKWLAAATIAAVVDEGKLSWDDKVSKWLPEFTGVKAQATLRQLLSHTAGYPDYQPPGYTRDSYQSLQESVAHIVGLPADTLPGTKFKYGGLAMQVAGRMAELATGMTWEDLFQQKIARPLGMLHTHFTPVDQAEGHSPMLGGAARTSLRDYSNFLKMVYHGGVFDGKRVLSSAAVDEMERDQVGQALVRKGEFVEEVRHSARKDVYGLGQWREETDENGLPVLLSSPSWAGAYPWIDKTTGVYGFFLTHVDPAKAREHGFSAFFSSPILPMLLRNALHQKN